MFSIILNNKQSNNIIAENNEKAENIIENKIEDVQQTKNETKLLSEKNITSFQLMETIYDKNFNKIWQRELDKTSQVVWDASNTNLIFVSDNDMYNINLETGEDIFSPVYVGKKNQVRITENGYILVGENGDDAVMLVDENGNKIKDNE